LLLLLSLFSLRPRLRLHNRLPRQQDQQLRVRSRKHSRAQAERVEQAVRAELWQLQQVD
jgi:hypothetical protein